MRTKHKPHTLFASLSFWVIIASGWSMPSAVLAQDIILGRILSSIGKDTRLEAYLPCYLKVYSNAVCVVTDTILTEGGTKLHKRSLLIYDVKRDGLDKVFQFDQEEYSGILSLRWMDSSTIMAIWATGSATVVTVFRVVGKDVKLVLEVGTEFSPEMVDLDGDGVDEVLISRGDWVFDKTGKRAFKPLNTAIYKFQNDRYVQVKVVRYKHRLTALGKP